MSKTVDQNELILEIHLEPLARNCSLCGGIESAVLRNDTVPAPTLGLSEFWGQTCNELDSFFSTKAIGDSVCFIGRMAYTQSCCCRIPGSLNECESNIHDQITDSLQNTVIPPDIVTIDDEEDGGGGMIQADVSLDLIQLLDIDIRTNTLELLVSFELIWIDERLKWNPFIGSCTTVSYRASLDPEQTEIWVPEIDLLNQVGGSTQSLPSSHATVFSNGIVWWRRTGVLKAASNLEGISMFPFDKPNGYLEFGGDRDPLAHRVNYSFGVAEYSNGIKHKTAKYQEYQVNVNNSNVKIESEVLSGYSNQIIRFNFHFERSSSYYIWMFIILYTLFTYMAFGMFFLDQQVGERLGFGTSILFVIVAEDIKITEYTPICQELLWIYQFSLGSKVFVIWHCRISCDIVPLFSR
mmetsp:Transcript_27467/g.40591  ORF Transcript_27467/g.40591 Transcript_27467/m.40591 type:complete len:409 (+) Transcript_27467:1069-2295(+)